MDPTTTVCPTGACPASGHIGQGHRGFPARQDRRFIGTPCGTTCSATTGTVFSRLRTSAETVVLRVTWLAHGGPVQASVAAGGGDERPGAAWGAGAGRHGSAGPASLVEPRRDLGPVHAAAIRVQPQGGPGGGPGAMSAGPKASPAPRRLVEVARRVEGPPARGADVARPGTG